MRPASRREAVCPLAPAIQVPVECVPVGCGASEPHAAESGEVGGRACAAQIGGFLKELRAFGGIRVQPLAAQHDDAEQVKGLGELSGGGLPEERERTAVLAAVGRVGEKAAGEFGLCGGIAAAASSSRRMSWAIASSPVRGLRLTMPPSRSST